MRLLILTQKVDKNDSLLGFFYRWVEEFSKKFEEVTVICLGAGEYQLPPNVRVLSLGKDSQDSRVQGRKFLRRFMYALRFYKYIWRERGNYDYVFVHMNREYVILGGLLWRILGKKIALWWVHFETPLALRVAEKLSHIVFTASEESFQLQSSKVRVVGHGIDLKRFFHNKIKETSTRARILYVGKITPIKNVGVLLRAAALLKGSWAKDFTMRLVGPTTTKKDEEYKHILESFVRAQGLEDQIFFVGSVPYEHIDKEYSNADLVVNLCPTGGVDKMVVEAMASRVPVIVANETFKPVFGEFWNDLSYPYQDEETLAEKIKNLFTKDTKMLEIIREHLFKESKSHDLERLIGKIHTSFSAL